MEISLKWLRDWIDLPETPETLGHRLTMAGLEVEGIAEYETVKGGLKGLVIGEVLECERHPNADKLSVTKVDVGQEAPLPIVCGAPNVAKGQKVVVALPGATLYPAEGEPFTIKKSKIRGEVSEGMICAEDEIGLGKSHEGIMVLDTQLPNGTPAADYFEISTDHVFTIGLTPNRADAASHLGVARDLSALFGRPLRTPYAEELTVGHRHFPIEVIIENAEACPRYSGITVTGVKVGPSPAWLQDRLKSIGLAPINNVVDATNFILHGLGQPLHAFDADKIEGRKVVVKNLPEGTPFVTLDGKERKLLANDLMICSETSPLCIAGVFGGLHSGVSETTTNVFIESAYFHPTSIRKTSQAHGLKTDASFRFERGTDPDMTVRALRIAANLIKQVAGGQIGSDLVDVYPEELPPFRVDVKYAHVDRLIGKVLPREQIKDILESLEISVVTESDTQLLVEVPRFRVDVQREADVIEEILRIYGYEQVEESPYLNADYLASFPPVSPYGLQLSLSETLAGAGFQEIMTNTLTRAQYAEWAGLNPENSVPIANPLSADLNVLRQTHLTAGLETILYNVNRKQKDLKLFEFGKVYRMENGQPHESVKLCLYVSGAQQTESWQAKPQPADFYTLSAGVQLVLGKLRIGGLTQTALQDPAFAYGALLTMKKGEVLGKMGLVAPGLLKKMDIPQAVFYAELDWELLLKAYQPKVTYAEIPKFPEVRRDLSLVMDKQVSFGQIQQVAQQTERKLLRQVHVFDVFEGKALGEGKKSYSVSFILQDATQTLTDAQIDKAMQRLMRAFEQELGAVIRGA